MKKLRILIFLILLWMAPGAGIWACTNFLVTRGASTDGSTMVSYAADSHIRYGELYFRPAADWPSGSTVTLYDRGTAQPRGSVPQVPHTYQTIGFMNEHQVAIGETTFGGRPELEDTTGIADYGSLMFLALQRARTAREAIRVIAELMELHGYGSTGESFSIGDPDEVWIMEFIGKGMDFVTERRTGTVQNRRKGAVWVAARIPDGYVSAHANHARITTFPLENGTTSISSKSWDKLDLPGLEVIYAHDVISFARQMGYYEGPDVDFSFSDAYAPLDFGAARFCELRVWSFYNKISPGMEAFWDYATGAGASERMPLYIKPDRKLSVRDLMEFKRDYLQGTELDMSLDAGAGPFGLPYRWRPLTWTQGEGSYFNERTTATQQTGFSFIAQMRRWLPDPVGGILWFGVDDAGSCVYVPFYCGIRRVPETWAEGNGDILSYSDDAAFWVFNRVAHFAYLFYSRVMVDLRAAQAELEGKFIDYCGAIDTAALVLWKNDPELAREFLTDYSCRMGDYTVKRWKRLGEFLLVKYLDGNIKQEKDGAFLRNPWGYPLSPQHPGYSENWKEMVVEESGEQFRVPE